RPRWAQLASEEARERKPTDITNPAEGRTAMGAAISNLFSMLATEAALPARAIATAVIIGIGLTLTLMPWEHGAVRFLKDSALRVAVGLAIVLNAAAIVSTMAGQTP